MTATIIDDLAEGEQLAYDAISKGAALSAQSLVQQEAEKLGCQLDVTVHLEDMSPKEIILEGSVSPYAKSAIGQWIKDNMGIPREAQIWIG